MYYDVLTTAGKEFIDVQAILRSCGLGIFDLRLKSLIDLFKDRLGPLTLNYYHYYYYTAIITVTVIFYQNRAQSHRIQFAKIKLSHQLTTSVF